ncbi:type VI lipase adapter Tla3 domain-containing protein [Holophaga foetida]|uniref:type VI lipase adapter Tla3 domain-containing protein n=1 Tax=Holophaga foetida TaxID=35839 RepID=UPI00130D58A2|nr:DUF2875 family protein [Holophaga foetida]
MLTALWGGALSFCAKPGTLVARLPRGVRIALVILPPLVIAGGLFLYARRPSVRKREREQEEQLAAEREAERERQEEEARQVELLVHKRFYLEVLSLGLAAEHLRQSEIWEAIRGEETASVLPEDPDLYPIRVEAKERDAMEREAEILQAALGWMTDEWSIPTFIAGPPLSNPKMASLLESNLADAVTQAGLPGKPLNIVECFHDETPDQVMEALFEFFENNAEVPAVLLLAEDGLVLRDCLRAEGAQTLLQEGSRSPQDVVWSMVALVLGRRDRLDPMRRLVPQEAAPDSVFKPFWEKEQPRRSAKSFEPTSWVPQVWSKRLLDSFSKMPVMGHLHRPQFVTYETIGEASRAKAFQEKWNELMDGRANEEDLAHLFFDYGAPEQGRRLTPLSRSLGDFDPDWDACDQGVNLHRSLGDAGSNGAFLGLALAVIAAQEEGGMGVSVNLRQEGKASLFMVTESMGKPSSGSEQNPHQTAVA